MECQTETMEQHIEKQLKVIRRKLCKQFDKTPMNGEMEFKVMREPSMVCEDFDSMLNKEWNRFEEALKDGNSCWDGVMDFELGVRIDHDDCDDVGMPLRWYVYAKWNMDGYDNPFYVLDQE